MRAGSTLLGLALLVPAAGADSGLNPPEVRASLAPALDCLFRQEFDEAQVRLEGAVDEFPDNPLVHLFQGGAWAVRMFDERTDTLEPEMKRSLDRAERCARAVLAVERDPWAELALGASLACRAVFQGWQGNYWGSFYWGMQAPEHLRRAREADPDFDEACLGLGIVEYFQYAAGRYLTGLRLFGSLPRALELVDRTVAGSDYFRTTARYVRAFILVRENRFDEGWALLNRLLEEYPESRMFRRLLRDSYVEGREYGAALVVAQDLEADAEESFPGNVSVFTDNWLALARGYAGLGDTAQARAYCDSILQHESRQAQVVGLKGYVREARKLKGRMRG